ncbi:diaminopimelate epimerase [Candidatus Endowatersipora endosymbiont of Watersipora subatra]|uniref:diaminopimelate epimerase n=1 Tax=Candidatus Endowatersipora endosymbiont of Watersipora subatra TaxID=3077946 RepID=UPI00312C9821
MVPFYKMNGLGNKILVVDMLETSTYMTPQLVLKMAQNQIIRFDQMMVVHKTENPHCDAKIIIFNANGSKADTCGNGIRCVVRWLHEKTGDVHFSFEIKGRFIDANIRDDKLISVNMGKARTQWNEIPLVKPFTDTRFIKVKVGPVNKEILCTLSVVNIGNPHAIFWIKKDLFSFELKKLGPLLEHHSVFPEGANISAAKVIDESEVMIRTWERGVGLTLACGSAACAAAVCAARIGLTGRKVLVNVTGGHLEIDWKENNYVVMTGPSEYEFSGQFDPITGEWERFF